MSLVLFPKLLEKVKDDQCTVFQSHLYYLQLYVIYL